ncbi:MAG: hypothetical protein P1U42_05815 [Phycisphaerales bacterium]|nr:hypothetical protein [Phycisphaerales bacterium]
MNDDRNQSKLYIGPDSTPDDPDQLLYEARERIRIEDEQNKESNRLARRLFIAMILITLLGVVFYFVLPYYGLRLSPTVPILSFLAIFAAAVLTGIEENRDNDSDFGDEDGNNPSSCNDDGCPTGMCGGPRPLQMFRDKKPPKR